MITNQLLYQLSYAGIVFKKALYSEEYQGLEWCRWRESDTRPLPYQGSALPLSYSGDRTEDIGFVRRVQEKKRKNFSVAKIHLQSDS